MRRERPTAMRQAGLCALLCLAILTLSVERSHAQGGGYERTFPDSKATVEKVLKGMSFSLGGRLPVLDGFALPGDHSLDRYQRGYFQTTVQVSTTPSGGSVVHVSTKVTAWYSDAIPSRSGYQLLPSNGRLEGDLLDQLTAELGKITPAGGATPPVAAPIGPPVSAPSISKAPTSSPKPAAEPPAAESAPSAPMPRLPDTGGTFSSSLAQDLAAQQPGSVPVAQNPPADGDRGLRAEAENLEEILKNQAHPKNLVAVKKSGTPVVASASLAAKTLFLASMHDEFEMLDFNTDWVHVRVSGLSRGWIWRNDLEMPEGIPDVGTRSGSAPGPAADELFHVSREESAPFPGDWEPLRNKRVKIISVQKTDEVAKDGGPKLKLEFAKSLLDKNYAELEKKTDELAGIVLIFDSADGGMIATTAGTLQQWKAGKLSDAALWHQSYFDPPETFTSAGPTASQ
jgi:hypothetical protein